ncbi:MAG TPA: hypothetical protein VIL86_11275 [Tepidisphaeraceae bacterium]
MDHDTAIKTIVARDSQIRTVTAQAELIFERPDGNSIRLDGAFATRLPDSLRLRAWKLGTAVFDLTLTPQGLWIMAGEQAGKRDPRLSQKVSAGELAKVWSLLNGNIFKDAEIVAFDTAGPRFTIKQVLEDDRVITCEVDRKTLTARRYHLFDPQGKERFTLDLNDYRRLAKNSTLVWPMEIIAAGEGGKFTADFFDLSINAELAPNTFTPPRRAEKQP